ncbi:MAG: diguanylate cyclase [Perlucidibaca sp.]
MMDDDLTRALAALTEQFASRLPQQLDTLARQAGSLRDSPQSHADPLRAQIIQQLHKLAGSAGSFGFDALGSHARRLELFFGDDDHFQAAQRTVLLQALDEIADLPRHVHASAAGRPPQPAAGTSREPGSRPGLMIYEAAPGTPGLLGTLATIGYVAERCDSRQQLLDAALQEARILILDLSGQSREDTVSLLHDLASQAGKADILLIADHGDFQIRLQAIRSGVVGLFATPLRLSELENRLERLLSRHQDSPWRVMIIDDDVELAQHYQLVLQRAGMDVVVTHEAEAALPLLYQLRPDLLLLDVNMPGCSGPELARIIRLDESLLQIPISYLSAESDVNRQSAALLHAGDDFLTKPIRDAALVTAVRTRAQRARLLAQAVARDSLTGLLRHNEIKARIAHELARRQRQTMAVTVAMIDIDHFKHINDNHGHPMGDQVIRALANLLRQRLRQTDGLGRYGGEEYAVVLVSCDTQMACGLLDQIRQAFAALVFEGPTGSFSATFSAGVAEATDPDTLSSLLERADQALYAAKQQGRNRIMTG